MIDQIRICLHTLTTGGHRGGRRVVIVDPAEAMNPFTANALLKLLGTHHPRNNPAVSSSPKATAADHPQPLPQTWTFPDPSPPGGAALASGTPSFCWGRCPAGAFCGGMPLAAPTNAGRKGGVATAGVSLPIFLSFPAGQRCALPVNGSLAQVRSRRWLQVSTYRPWWAGSGAGG